MMMQKAQAMKVDSPLGQGIRFIALSATVPNPNDIAQWLGGVYFEFGPE